MKISLTKRPMAILLAMSVVAAGTALARESVVPELLDDYRRAGAGPADPAAGERLWTTEYPDARTGKKRSCVTCHTKDLRKNGKHARTGKRIEPMAPSVNPERLTDRKKVEKWFHRNCKWTLGRTCTAQEKADVLKYLEQW